MADSWSHTRSSFQRLRSGLAEADEDTRYRFAFWLIGLTLMAVAIIGQFGWLGFVFCLGLVVYSAGSDMRSTP